jgi:hypothetical protein
MSTARCSMPLSQAALFRNVRTSKKQSRRSRQNAKNVRRRATLLFRTLPLFFHEFRNLSSSAGRLGWSLRRIERETGIHQETAAVYLRGAEVAVRPPWGAEPVCKTGHTSLREGVLIPDVCDPTLNPL